MNWNPYVMKIVDVEVKISHKFSRDLKLDVNLCHDFTLQF